MYVPELYIVDCPVERENTFTLVQNRKEDYHHEMNVAYIEKYMEETILFGSGRSRIFSTDNRRKLDADVVHLLVSNLRDLQPDATVTPKLNFFRRTPRSVSDKAQELGEND
uniref:Uncharacterized protein n=1 Tax=Caenorhabditis japonica TaxID=281687 RepID=A0A8R1IPD6_CAEJA